MTSHTMDLATAITLVGDDMRAEQDPTVTNGDAVKIARSKLDHHDIDVLLDTHEMGEELAHAYHLVLDAGDDQISNALDWQQQYSDTAL
jgi:hypothetical protein